MELAKLGKDAFLAKYYAYDEQAFADYFQATWQPKKFTYAECCEVLPTERPEMVSACVPPQSNAIERQNLAQKLVGFWPAPSLAARHTHQTTPC